MINASKRVCSAILLGIALACAPAWAHKASDAYLQLAISPAHASFRVDVALRDLDVALDLDADGDGQLTWAEVKAAWPAIEGYLRANIDVAGCEWPVAAQALERRVDGTYAALTLTGHCEAAIEHAIRYTVLRDVDPTHRGLARVQAEGRQSTLVVLDPARPQSIAAHVAASPTSALTEPSAHRANLVAPSASPVSAEAVHAAITEAPLQFLREGIHHIVTGYDHVLFLLCLMLPSVMRRTARGWRPVERLGEAVMPVIGIVTAFTLAHSITLGLAAMKWVSLSPAFIEPAIAVTIMLAALDNVRPIFRGRRALVTFCFGLIHGFGFAGVLSELKLPASDFAWALLQFNLGIELGQLGIVCIAVALLFIVRDRPRYPAWVIRGGSCAAMLVGLLWFIERTANVSLLPM